MSCVLTDVVPFHLPWISPCPFYRRFPSHPFSGLRCTTTHIGYSGPCPYGHRWRDIPLDAKPRSRTRLRQKHALCGGQCRPSYNHGPPPRGNRPDEHATLLPRIPHEVRLSSGHTLIRRQFPLAPAYSTTFNGCQGLTLDRIGVDLTQPVFSHGQLYTALSRERNRHSSIARMAAEATSTTNVTFEELLL